MSIDRQRQELEDVYRTHRTRLRDLAQRIVGTRDRAEDVLHCAYLRIVDVPGRAPIQQPLRYWFQVVRHIAIDCRRRMSWESEVFADETHAQTVATLRSSPEQVAISVQYLGLVEQILLELPLRTRLAFHLYRLDGLTQREIANQLGVSPTLVNFMIRDAREALKQCRSRFERD